MEHELKAVVLAAGKGTRLQTEGCDLPKVMREVCSRPLLHYVLKALSFIPAEDTTIVVGYRKEEVKSHFFGYKYAEQAEQLGTGHAVSCALEQSGIRSGHVLVCCGDMPLLKEATYRALVEEHLQGGFDCTMLTGSSRLPLPYGRVVRDENGSFLRIVEDRDCTPEEKTIEELNSGVYVFSAAMLAQALGSVGNDNAQGEYYLTDVPPIIQSLGGTLGVCRRELGYEIIGVNTIEQLRQVEEIVKSGE